MNYSLKGGLPLGLRENKESSFLSLFSAPGNAAEETSPFILLREGGRLMNGISFLPARDKGAEKSMAVKIVFSLSTATYRRRDIGQFSVLPNGPFKEKKGVNSPDCMQFLRTGKVAARSTFCFLRRPHFHRERDPFLQMPLVNRWPYKPLRATKEGNPH